MGLYLLYLYIYFTGTSNHVESGMHQSVQIGTHTHTLTPIHTYTPLTYTHTYTCHPVLCNPLNVTNWIDMATMEWNLHNHLPNLKMVWNCLETVAHNGLTWQQWNDTCTKWNWAVLSRCGFLLTNPTLKEFQLGELVERMFTMILHSLITPLFILVPKGSIKCVIVPQLTFKIFFCLRGLQSKQFMYIVR